MKIFSKKLKIRKNIIAITTCQIIKNISLMNMDCDEGLVLHAFGLRQILCRDADELIEHVQKALISGLHNLSTQRSDCK